MLAQHSQKVHSGLPDMLVVPIMLKGGHDTLGRAMLHEAPIRDLRCPYGLRCTLLAPIDEDGWKCLDAGSW